jgi:hypothetical protein
MVTVSAVAGYALLKLAMGQVRDQLRENGSAGNSPTIVPPPPILLIAPVSVAFSFKSFFPGNPTYERN